MAQSAFITQDEAASALAGLLASAELVFVKKLSNNDRLWASDRAATHQWGPYIPAAQRDSGFFPPLVEKQFEAARAYPVLEVFFPTRWPQLDTDRKSRLVNYRSKGEETHLTGVPKEVFATLPPASLLVMGRRSCADGPAYECITIESGTDDALLLVELFELGPDFVAGVFSPVEQRRRTHEQVLDFATEILAAWQRGEIAAFAAEHGVLPDTATLAAMARTQFLSERGLQDLNPFHLETPGNDLREISRGIEWRLFREFQLRTRAVALVRIILGDEPAKFTFPEIVRIMIERVPEIDALMLSASQQRKSRAGYSFEHHIEQMLRDGGMPFEKQVIMEARKRPDFVLPSLHFLRNPTKDLPRGLILSAKTTLRERWKQVQREMGSHELFLATVDEDIAGNAIEDMRELGIRLVVPEDLKKSRDTDYGSFSNVIDFRTFFEVEIAQNRLPAWGPRGGFFEGY